MAKENTSVEYNLYENFDSEGYKNDDIGDTESIVPDSDQDFSAIEVLSVGSSEVTSDHIDFRDELDDNGPNTVNDATVNANANIPNWTTNFTDITIEPLFRKVVLINPSNFPYDRTYKLFQRQANILY